MTDTHRKTDTLVYDIFVLEDGEDIQLVSNNEDEDNHTRTIQSMFKNSVCGSPEDDIGMSSPNKPPEGKKLLSGERTVLEKMHAIIVNEKVNKSRMGIAPSWVIEKAMRQEVIDNWSKAYVT